jgi:hypothetical protein
MRKAILLVRAVLEVLFGGYLFLYAVLLGLPKGIGDLIGKNIAYGLGDLAGAFIVGTLGFYIMKDGMKVGQRALSKAPPEPLG